MIVLMRPKTTVALGTIRVNMGLWKTGHALRHLVLVRATTNGGLLN